MNKQIFSFALLLTISAISACTNSGSSGSSGGGGGSSGGSSAASIRQQSVTTTADAAGEATFTFTIQSGETAFQLIGNNSVGPMKLESLTGPDGTSIVSSITDPSLSGALTIQTPPVIFNAPLISGSISPGTYAGKFLVQNSRGTPISGAPVSATIVSKSDSDFSGGVLKVNMVLVGPASAQGDLRKNLESAVNHWAEIFQNAGITLDVSWFDFSGGSTIPDPASGDTFYTTSAQALRANSLNMFVGNYVQNTSRLGSQFGRSGSSPGAAIPTPKSGVSIAVLKVTGSDGTFNYTGQGGVQVTDDEVRLAGEEMARLAGQYLGLSNIVDTNGSSLTNVVIATDPLSDTASCTTVLDCGNGDAHSNFMFPFPLQKLASDQTTIITSYYSRDQVTPLQSAVMNRSVLVN